MELLISIVVNLAIIVLAFKLYFWSRRQAKAHDSMWRRRVTLLFLLLPFAITLFKALPGVPDAWITVLEQLDVVRRGVDRVYGTIIEGVRESLPGPVAFAIKPLCYLLVYGGLGFLIGWPLDRLFGKKQAQDEGKDGGGQSPDDGSSPA